MASNSHNYYATNTLANKQECNSSQLSMLKYQQKGQNSLNTHTPTNSHIQQHHCDVTQTTYIGKAYAPKNTLRTHRHTMEKLSLEHTSMCICNRHCE